MSVQDRSTVESSRGRWHGLLGELLGVSQEVLDGKHRPCPACGGKDRFRFTDRSGDGDYYCSKCGSGKGFGLLMKVTGWDFRTAAARVDAIVGKVPSKKAAPQVDERKRRRMLRDLWRSSRPISPRDPAGLYLAMRGIESAPPVLRFVPEMRYQGIVQSVHPGMIARVDDCNGKASTIHRTYLTVSGRKADVVSPRRTMPGPIPQGGAVRLAEYSDVLGVAEGIETALSATIIHAVPCWATLNENGMRNWEPPPGLKQVVVFGDNDENYVGQSAAMDLAKRLQMSGIKAQVRIPDKVDQDWNDVLMER